MRKQIIGKQGAKDATQESRNWLDLESLVQVELTSEDPAHPIEAAIHGDAGRGWQAAEPGAQSVRLRFDVPTPIRYIRLVFCETATPRTQEFVLRWRSSTDPDFREIVRQQYNFNLPDGTEEQEDYTVKLDDLAELELSIVPDISGGPARASLAQLRLA